MKPRRAHRLAGRAARGELEDLPAQLGRPLRHRPAFLAAINQVEHFGIAGVAARLAERPPREGILVQ